MRNHKNKVCLFMVVVAIVIVAAVIFAISFNSSEANYEMAEESENIINLRATMEYQNTFYMQSSGKEETEMMGQVVKEYNEQLGEDEEDKEYEIYMLTEDFYWITSKLSQELDFEYMESTYYECMIEMLEGRMRDETTLVFEYMDDEQKANVEAVIDEGKQLNEEYLDIKIETQTYGQVTFVKVQIKPKQFLMEGSQCDSLHFYVESY